MLVSTKYELISWKEKQTKIIKESCNKETCVGFILHFYKYLLREYYNKLILEKEETNTNTMLLFLNIQSIYTFSMPYVSSYNLNTASTCKYTVIK